MLKSSISDAHHRFVAEECDWGFTRFSELRKLFSIQEGNARPTIEEESADITVYVRVLEDPTGVLWHNFVKYALYAMLNLDVSDNFQLRFEERNGLCWSQEPRGHVLYELSASVTLLHEIFSQSMSRSHVDVSLV